MATQIDLTYMEPQNDNSSSSEEDEPSENLPYSKRPEWQDVTPLPQNDGKYNVVRIRYSPCFEETFNYFRAILASNEASERAWQLTKDCIKLNPGNYTVWHYRRVLLDKLEKNLLDELNFIENVIIKNQKNYQVWEHYKCILERIRQNEESGKNDLACDEVIVRVKTFIKKTLADDSKNYHAWQHLQWFIKELQCFEGELEFTVSKLDDDIRNNSAWNHRFYVLQSTTSFTDQVILDECRFVTQKIELAPHNESAWNYLLGLFRKNGKSFDLYPPLWEFSERLYENAETRSRSLLSFKITYLCAKLKPLVEGGDQHEPQARQDWFNKAIELCSEQETVVDKIRSKYWKHVAEKIHKKYGIAT